MLVFTERNSPEVKFRRSRNMVGPCIPTVMELERILKSSTVFLPLKTNITFYLAWNFILGFGGCQVLWSCGLLWSVFAEWNAIWGPLTSTSCCTCGVASWLWPCWLWLLFWFPSNPSQQRLVRAHNQPQLRRLSSGQMSSPGSLLMWGWADIDQACMLILSLLECSKIPLEESKISCCMQKCCIFVALNCNDCKVRFLGQWPCFSRSAFWCQRFNKKHVVWAATTTMIVLIMFSFLFIKEDVSSLRPSVSPTGTVFIEHWGNPLIYLGHWQYKHDWSKNLAWYLTT